MAEYDHLRKQFRLGTKGPEIGRLPAHELTVANSCHISGIFLHLRSYHGSVIEFSKSKILVKELRLTAGVMRRRRTKVETSGIALYYNLLQLIFNLTSLLMTATAVVASSKFV